MYLESIRYSLSAIYAAYRIRYIAYNEFKHYSLSLRFALLRSWID